MQSLLSRLRTRTLSAYKFVYVPDAEDGPMRAARVGSIVRNADQRPPWIVVDRNLNSIIVAKWPGRLWKVEIIEAAPIDPNSSGLYTRAVAVRVMEEIPASQLFGPHGAAVCKVIEKTRNLKIEEVQALGASPPNSSMYDAYSRVLKNWLDKRNPMSAFQGQDDADTPASEADKPRSPIGYGGSVLGDVLTARARTLVGDAAFVVDEEGEENFAPLWSNAYYALMGAAAAYGAPELMSSTDRELLTSVWVNCFGEL